MSILYLRENANIYSQKDTLLKKINAYYKILNFKWKNYQRDTDILTLIDHY